MDIDSENSIGIKTGHGVSYSSHSRRENATESVQGRSFRVRRNRDQYMTSSQQSKYRSRLAQLVERVTSNDEVSRSSRLTGIFCTNHPLMPRLAEPG